jgi:uncharacterized RDD family membrane protein YckC
MRRTDQEPLLFDLPLDRPARDENPEHPQDPPAPGARGSRDARSARDARDAARAEGNPRTASRPSPTAPRAPTSAPSRGLATAPAAPLPAAAPQQLPDAPRAAIGRRLAGGGADLLVHAAVGVVAFVGCRYLGVFPVVRDWPAGAVFLLSFSFLYTVVPLAFWGHTLGMTWAGLTAQSTDGEPLSFDQTARRWFGALGLPLLLAALGGRSLADRLSGSRTLPAH